MVKTYFLFLWIFLGVLSGAVAQENESHIHVLVNLVQLNVAVTDNKGDYITGLRPQDFVITEDKITQKIATFGEGNEPTRRLVDSPSSDGKPLTQTVGQLDDSPAPVSAGDSSTTLGSLVAGANVFILFDTSNYMYRGFVFAQDAISDFVRSLESANKIAFYSYSRDLSRAAPLTADRSQVLRGVRTTVAGDEAALYNCLLLTVKDAAKYTGKKSDCSIFQRSRQRQHGASGRCGSAGAIDGNIHLHDQHSAGPDRTGVDSCVRTYDQGHWRQSVFC